MSVICLAAIGSNAWADAISIEPAGRIRFQDVSDTQRGDASASTLKLRLNANWQASDTIDVFAQADHVHAFDKDYNSVAIMRATSPIADTYGSELNQAWVRYNSEDDWQVSIGRQVINTGNQRHVSSVEFWQNDQTFDAIGFSYNDSLAWDISYYYVSKVHRIYGDDATKTFEQDDLRFNSDVLRPFLELGNHNHDSHLLNVNYAFNRYTDVSFYANLLDNQTASQLSSNTFGFRLNSEIKPNQIKYAYTFELAHQKTASNSAWDYSGFYGLAEISAQYKSHQLALTHERLSEDNGFAFATSLGDNHKFLGWADIFTSYLNNDGVRDTFITYKGRDAKLRWRIVAHQYTSDTTGKIAGHELDLEVAYRFNRKWEASLIGAKYFSKNGIQGLAASQNDLSTVTVSLSYNL